MTKPSILVFAYHDVGYECLDFLIENDENILAVITHKDDPNEEIWFRSVAKLAAKNSIPVYAPETVNTNSWIEQIRTWQPDIIFSFYYRNLLPDAILSIPRLGAFNMHGSLLPKYRGRAPINWAVLHGETETGVTLHHMARKADAGDIVDQEAVPIGREDTAFDVFKKATAAARKVLTRQIEAIKAGKAPRIQQDESKASYFGGRKPEDGKIDWSKSAEEIYNLIRAVTHPYPGAFTSVEGKKLLIWWAKPRTDPGGTPGRVLSGEPLIIAAGVGALEILNAEWEDEDIDDVQLNVGSIVGS